MFKFSTYTYVLPKTLAVFWSIFRRTSPVVVYVETDTVKPVQKKSIAKLAICSGVPSQNSCRAVNGVKPWAMQLCWFFRMLPLKSVARTDVDRIEVSLSFPKHGEEGADKQDRVLISPVKEINKIARRALQCWIFCKTCIWVDKKR